jgi:hypothetical protein
MHDEIVLCFVFIAEKNTGERLKWLALEVVKMKVVLIVCVSM